MSGAAVVLRDITSRKKTLEKIERLSSAVEQTADAVIITDLKGTITCVNERFERRTGYSREEAVGGTPRLLKSGEHETRFYQDLWKTALDGNVSGTYRLLEFIKHHRHYAASGIVVGLCRTARSSEAWRPQVDDMTVVICKTEPAP